MKSFALIGALCLSLAFAACGGGGTADTTQAGGQPAASHIWLKAKVPHGPPPKKLTIKELKVGTGPAVKATDEIAVQYVGVAYKTGKAFSYRRLDAPFWFQVGLGRVMPGFDKGVVGMKVGGRREVTIPPDLTLNELGKPETLIYVIELLKIESAAEYEKRNANGTPATIP